MINMYDICYIRDSHSCSNQTFRVYAKDKVNAIRELHRRRKENGCMHRIKRIQTINYVRSMV